jgi:hypothetical protein
MEDDLVVDHSEHLSREIMINPVTSFMFSISERILASDNLMAPAFEVMDDLGIMTIDSYELGVSLCDYGLHPERCFATALAFVTGEIPLDMRYFAKSDGGVSIGQAMANLTALCCTDKIVLIFERQTMDFATNTLETQRNHIWCEEVGPYMSNEPDFQLLFSVDTDYTVGHWTLVPHCRRV